LLRNFARRTAAARATRGLIRTMTFRRFLAWLFAAAAAFALAANAADVVRPLDLFDLGAPAFTTFSARDGVPESVIVSTATDRDGFVWLASAQGLARYDGHRWDSSVPPATEGAIGYLMTDHAGRLWASFRDRGVARFDGSAWRFDGPQSGLPSRHLRRLVETVDAHGSPELWAATFDAGLWRRDGTGHWQAAPGNAQLPPGILSVARTHTLGGHERLWAGSFNEGLWYREDGDWQRLRTAQFDPAQIEHLLTVEYRGREELWISAFGSGLWRLDPDGIRAWSVASGDLASNELYDIASSGLADGDRAIWVASRAGLVRVHDDKATTFDRRYGLPSNVVRGLSIWRSPDGIDVLWLATEAGVARTIVGAHQWRTASLMGSQSTGVFGVLVEADGSGGERLWIASSQDGLGLYEHGSWRYFSQANGALPDSDMRMIKRAADDDGQPALWLGGRMGYLMRVRDGPVFERVPGPWEQHAGEAIMDVLSRKFDGRRERWIVTRQSGLYRWRDQHWTAFRPAAVTGQWRAVALLEQVDAQGRSWLWSTSNQGLARFDGSDWTLLGRDAGLPDIALSGLNLIPDRAGRPVLWIGSTNSGIVRMDVSDPLHPQVLAADLPPAPDATAYGALRDSQGRIYICTNVGVQMLTPSAAGWDSRVFTRKDGIVHEECNTNAQFIDAHDRFWTGTLGGATVFDPDYNVHDRQAKPLHFTALLVDGKPVAAERFDVAPGKHELHAEFALLSWRRESESRFRTQLLGYESAPGAWTAQNFRNFNALPHGEYVLRIEGRDYAGNLSKPIELPVTVAAAWWQRAWATVVFALAALIAIIALLRWRTRSLHAQRERLAHDVAERTIELHTANARLLQLSYEDSLTGLANRRALLEALHDAARAHARASLVFVDVDHFKDYNDHFGHPAGDEALCCVARTLRACVPEKSLVARYGGEEFACLLLGTELGAAIDLAERIRAAVEVTDAPIPATVIVNHLTISAGVATATLTCEDDAHRLLREADNKLYQAKNDGRNCVIG
jgi:diguanylate cyclase (GGDEF)-like protein